MDKKKNNHQRIKKHSLKRFFEIIFLGFVSLVFVSYGMGKYYQKTHQSEPEFGATFISDYASYLGVDPKEALHAAAEDLGITRFRLVSYWDKIEATQGSYDFSDLDWQFDYLESRGATISLAIGLRQPRWPECHEPTWVKDRPITEWREDLNRFIQATVERYKDRISLVSYQLENEYFLRVFGDCPDFERQRLVDEFNLVKSIDNNTPIIVTRSNNATPSWPVGAPRADVVGGAVYKRVYDRVTKRYFEYPLPSWYYGFLAQATLITTNREMFVHELQGESWAAPGYSIKDAPLEELYQTMSPEILTERLNYARSTGMQTIDLWGIEWWYQLKTQRNAPEMWNTAKDYLNH